MDKLVRMKNELKMLERENLYRDFRVIEGPQNSHVTYKGRDMVMLASNAYLDLANNSKVKAYAKKVMNKYGTGSGGSRLTTGTTDIHMQLEKNLAKLKHREAALVFNTGFATNTGIISAICGEGDAVFSDELNHASIIDGCRASKAKIFIYKHNDMRDLEQKINTWLITIKNTRNETISDVLTNKIATGKRTGLIVTDAVFSMDGDIADLPGLASIADRYGLLTMVDEAHSTGVIGETGRGIEEHYHMEGSIDICMGTLSKAIGAEGGFVCGSRTLIEYLKNKARSFIFSTSLSPTTMAAADRAVRLIMEEPQMVRNLQENVKWFCECLKENGLPFTSETAIVPVVIGDEKKAQKVAKKMMEKGYFISAIRYPTVKKGEAILRVALMSTHTKEELRSAAEAIRESIYEVENDVVYILKEKVLSGGELCKEEIMQLVNEPLDELTEAADEIRQKFCGDGFDICTIINAKCGRCPEDCKYCAQSAHNNTELKETYPLLSKEELLAAAKKNADAGVLRYSIVTSGRKLSDEEIDSLCESIRAIKEETDIEVCVSVGMQTGRQFRMLAKAGASRVHCNLETSERYFPSVCTTHTYREKLTTLRAAKTAGLSLCSGGILGMGESVEDRIDMVLTARKLGVKSVPVNVLIPIPGTPYEKNTPLTNDEVCRMVAIFRFIIPDAAIRLAGGRGSLGDKGEACFKSGANAAISGDMLTTAGITIETDMELIKSLGYEVRLSK